jgi:hypothetical protein
MAGGRRRVADWSGATWWAYCAVAPPTEEREAHRLLLFHSDRTGKWLCLEWPVELGGPDDLDAGQLRALLTMARPVRREQARRLVHGKRSRRRREGA